MAHLPPHSLFLLFLAVHVFVASHGSPLPPSSAYNDSVCSESIKCGGVDIRYPFYLDTEALISGGKCPTVAHNVTFGKEWLNYTGSLEELTFFFGCYSTEGDHLPPDSPLRKFQIDCKGFNPPAGSGDGVSFVFTSEEGNVSREYELAEYCSQKVIVPVLEKNARRSGPLVLPRDYDVVLEQGFELEWKQGKEQQCQQCEESHKGRCAFNEKKEYLACLCSGGICKNPNPPSSGQSFTTGPSILFTSANRRPITTVSACQLPFRRKTKPPNSVV
uniref:Wall-associated receptor kinase C-terminal domain-containing protein n=1 Tax=Triticum aestivum TaxID=4565 RepID=A0A077RUI3_WHEAT|nr:unnamed protein product [Triticum aestivum]